MLEQFDNLSPHNQEILLEFLANLTEGDVIKIANEMSMDRGEIRDLRDALDEFQNA